ncbi:hypothetical protein SDC9_197550 [bioreactor metagenome]|uniref:Uncharacterized protein n=1 Tax=bioreactor metagenome TaxID=1076179 RepID=A0A645IG40_9ZZZZ
MLFFAESHAFRIFEFAAVDHETGNVFVVINFREKSEGICETCIRNPHFLPVDDVVFSVFGKSCFGFSGIGIRTRIRLGQTVGSEFCSGRQIRQVFFLLLFSSVEQNGQSSNPGMCSVSGCQ